jgi:hypothetical protein
VPARPSSAAAATAPASTPAPRSFCPVCWTTNVECDFDSLEIGMPLEVLFRDIADVVTIPVFRPRANAAAAGGAA